MIGWPKKPELSELSADDLANLEKLGIERVRRMLAQTGKNSRLYTPDGPYDKAACVWLDWKAEKAALWIKVGVLLAFVAAVASVTATVEGWRWPLNILCLAERAAIPKSITP